MEASGLVSRVASLLSLNVVMLCRLSAVVDVGEVQEVKRAQLPQ